MIVAINPDAVRIPVTELNKAWFIINVALAKPAALYVAPRYRGPIAIYFIGDATPQYAVRNCRVALINIVDLPATPVGIIASERTVDERWAAFVIEHCAAIVTSSRVPDKNAVCYRGIALAVVYSASILISFIATNDTIFQDGSAIKRKVSGENAVG
jgi:hypothetical protein